MRSLPITPLRGQGMPDQFGRMARDLRVSVTDRCNLRCTYCMPAEGLPWLPKPEMLTDEELLRVVGVFVGLGVRQVRLTGGEPLLRRSLTTVVRGIAGMTPRPQIAMTTNGIGLDRLAGPLAEAGLDRVNVSLDTVDPSDFLSLTRRDRFGDVERGLKAAASAGLTPVKVNAVAMRGINDRTVADVLQWCLDRGYDLRFIEQMPLDAQHAWDRGADGHRRRGAGPAVRAVHAHPDARRRPGERPGRAVPRRRRTGHGRHHRQRVGSRSAPPATGSGSPRTGRCATACSPRARSTCAGRCATAPRTTTSSR